MVGAGLHIHLIHTAVFTEVDLDIVTGHGLLLRAPARDRRVVEGGLHVPPIGECSQPPLSITRQFMAPTEHAQFAYRPLFTGPRDFCLLHSKLPHRRRGNAEAHQTHRLPIRFLARKEQVCHTLAERRLIEHRHFMSRIGIEHRA